MRWRRAIPILVLAAAPSVAEAQVINENPAYWAIVGVGTVAGLANSVAGIVYALQDRSFDTPWIISSLFSSAICAVWSGQLMYDAATNGATAFNAGGSVLYLAVAAWPAAWVILSSLSEVEPGEPFDGEVETETTPEKPVTTDPIGALQPVSPGPPTFTLFAFEI